jgi:putative aminopeptidase FrvX
VNELIRKLVEAFGPVGYEDEVRQIVRAELMELADEVRVSRLGSLIAVKKGSGRGQKIMLAAHMDEIGLIVTHVDNRGYARVTQLGSVSAIYSAGQRVRFANGQLGVVDVERREDPQRAPTLDQLYIDVGAKDKQSCPVQVGDVACFHRRLEQDRSRLVAKSLDDRLGCAILIETLRRLPSSPHDIFCVFSVQAETSSAGARTAAYDINPDLAIVVDLTSTGDTPKALPVAVELGKGPAIKVQDATMLADLRVKKWMVQHAREARLPYQLEVSRDSATDAGMIQISRAGVPSGGLLVPGRHLHSPSEMVDRADVEHAVKLLLTLLNKPIEL